MKKFLIFAFAFLGFSAASQTVFGSGVQGLTYETYAGTGASPSINPLDNPTVRSTGISPNINYPTGSFNGVNILGSGLADRVIVKWTGFINLAAGTYSFGANADDGFIVNINGTDVVHSWIESGNQFRSGPAYQFAAGVYPITVWYYENGGGQAITFQYWTGSQWAIVPSSMLATHQDYWTPPPPVSASAVYTNYAISNAQTIKRNSGLAANPNGHNTVVEIVGDDNLITIQQIGISGHYVDVSVQGNVNSVNILQTSTTTSRHYMETTVNGSNNNLTLQQRETAKTQFVDVAGNYNTITTNQKGTGNHFLDLSVSGNNHTASVIQDGSGNHNARVILNGSQPWNFTLNQSGATGQNYNLPHSMSDGSAVSGTCSAIGGCNLTVNQQ